MRLSNSDPMSTSPDTSSHAGPSSVASDRVTINGHTNGFGPIANGNSGTSAIMGNGLPKLSKTAKVILPGTTLYEDSSIDREEFVRLAIQTLRDVGYMCVPNVISKKMCLRSIYSTRESAATLEAESGYEMESSEVSQFKQYVLEGAWAKAEATLERLCVDGEGLCVCLLSICAMQLNLPVYLRTPSF